MTDNILIIVAHPDDAEFGMGGTIAKLSTNNNITLCILCKGNRPYTHINVQNDRQEALLKNKKILGIKTLIQSSFDDVSLDTVPHLKLTSYLSKIINKFKPNIVFTNYEHDIHIDHQIISHAVRVACRPRLNSTVNRLYEFSVPGSGEWNFKGIDYNTFIDISDYTKKKYDSIQNYKTELQPSPDPLSIEKIKTRDSFYGGNISTKFAEPFILIFNKE